MKLSSNQNCAVRSSAKGIVIGGVGNGNMTRAALEGLAEATRRGVAVVHSSRTGSGAVYPNVEVDDDANGFITSMNAHAATGLLCAAKLTARGHGRDRCS